MTSTAQELHPAPVLEPGEPSWVAGSAGIPARTLKPVNLALWAAESTPSSAKRRRHRTDQASHRRHAPPTSDLGGQAGGAGGRTGDGARHQCDPPEVVRAATTVAANMFLGEKFPLVSQRPWSEAQKIIDDRLRPAGACLLGDDFGRQQLITAAHAAVRGTVLIFDEPTAYHPQGGRPALHLIRRLKAKASPSSTSAIAWKKCSNSPTVSRCCATVRWSAPEHRETNDANWSR
jgi:ribose transport system ATP-binding protein